MSFFLCNELTQRRTSLQHVYMSSRCILVHDSWARAAGFDGYVAFCARAVMLATLALFFLRATRCPECVFPFSGFHQFSVFSCFNTRVCFFILSLVLKTAPGVVCGASWELELFHTFLFISFKWMEWRWVASNVKIMECKFCIREWKCMMVESYMCKRARLTPI